MIWADLIALCQSIIANAGAGMRQAQVMRSEVSP